jgi:inhibitor of cysteine peptidase
MRAKIVPILLLALAAGCGTLERQTPTLANAANEGGAIALKKGGTLVVALEGNATTGYRWQTLSGTGEVLSQIGTPDYLPPEVAPGTVGAAGDMVFRYRAEKAGTTTLELGYLRPFETGVAPAKTARYTVTVQ